MKNLTNANLATALLDAETASRMHIVDVNDPTATQVVKLDSDGNVLVDDDGNPEFEHVGDPTVMEMLLWGISYDRLVEHGYAKPLPEPTLTGETDAEDGLVHFTDTGGNDDLPTEEHPTLNSEAYIYMLADLRRTGAFGKPKDLMGALNYYSREFGLCADAFERLDELGEEKLADFCQRFAELAAAAG